jgi:hypothetical protein
MIFLSSLSAFAGPECALYELSGNVVIEKTDMIFVVAKKTLSEKKLPIHYKLSNDFAPFVNRYSKGTFILRAQSILAIKSIDYATPDPLNQNQSTTSKKLKDVPCPKL